MLINEKLPSPLYNAENGKQAARNRWHVREIGSDQPRDQSWRAWWESKSLGKGHIIWRSTCIYKNAPDPFNPPQHFEVDFSYKGTLYHLQFDFA